MDKCQAGLITEILFMKHQNKMFLLSRPIDIKVNLTTFKLHVLKRLVIGKGSSG